MNYYRRYVGDYLRDTAHLSMLEHGAYTLLLDHYYSAGKSLPAGLEPLYRMCRAMTKPERAAVQSVVEKFFPVGEDGRLHNRRADEEIAKSEAAIEKQRKSGIESAEKRWSTHRSTHESTHWSTIQPPTTNHQPKEKRKSGAASRLHTLPADFKISTRVREWAMEKGFAKHLDAHFEVFLSYVARKNPKYADWDEALMTCVRDDWGGVRAKSGPSAVASTRPSRVCSDCKKSTFTWTGDRCDPCWKKYMGLAA